jgi:uncharacterized protein (DUF849 family)
VLSINGKRFYSPREIEALGLIRNTRGRQSYRFVLDLIKNKQLKAVVANTSTKLQYFAISEDEITNYNKRFNPQYDINIALAEGGKDVNGN